jgi:hypothetical protein
MLCPFVLGFDDENQEAQSGEELGLAMLFSCCAYFVVYSVDSSPSRIAS